MILFNRRGAEKFTLMLNGPFHDCWADHRFAGAHALPLCEPWRLPLRMLS